MALLYILTSMYLLGYAYQCLSLKEQAKEQHLMMIKIENLRLDVNNIHLDIIKYEGEVVLATLKKLDNKITENYEAVKKDLSELREMARELELNEDQKVC